MWTKWLANFVICDLSCAHGSTCFVWWFILQTIPKEFKKSLGVLVSLQPSQITADLAFDLHPAHFTASWLPGATKDYQIPWCKIIIWLQVLFFHKVSTELLGKYIYAIWNYKFIPWDCCCNHTNLSLKQIQFLLCNGVFLMFESWPQAWLPWACWVMGCNGAHLSWIKSCCLLF